ncbi:MAG: dehydrogenase, partial [Thermoplasmata archaeon]|nr:dehydrogenase [Thermoplasmata archaeon]
MSSIILPLLIVLPLIGAVATLFMGGERQKLAKYVALAFSLVTLVVTIYVMVTGLDSGWSQFDFEAKWIETSSIYIGFDLVVDGLSILMLFLSALLTPLVIVFSSDESDRPNYFHTLLLAMEVGLMGV